MASILITGSSAGIGLETAAVLLRQGHRVVAHARDKARGAETGEALPGLAAVVLGDLSSLEETRALAEDANEQGPYDAVVHNAGVGSSSRRELTADGLEQIFQVNVLAPYVLTALIKKPKRLLYLTSGTQQSGRADLSDLQHERGRWSGMQAYSDSKLWDVVLAFAVARRWPGVLSNAVDPGWVQTRMGGRGAPDPVKLGAEPAAWLATSGSPEALVTGRFFRRRRDLQANPAAYDASLQDRFVEACRSLSGVVLPGRS
jgi:NAD(P)-dependent dehydrogenase (short-subunit alcohol dehydrogenase family)